MLLSDPNVTVVPLNQSANASEVRLLLEKTDASCLVYSNALASVVAAALAAHVPTNKNNKLLLISLPSAENETIVAPSSFSVLTFESFLARGDDTYRVDAKKVVDHKQGTNVCIFSSGSTGEPKGHVSSSAC